MKRIIAISFVLAFLFQSTSSFWILTTFYIQRDYISQNLCVNRFEAIPVCKGQCYLANQLDDNQKKQEKIPEVKLKEVQLFIHTYKLDFFHSFSLPNQSISPEVSENVDLSEFVFTVFHPPKKA